MVVITAGVAQQPGESRLSLVDRNANILKLLSCKKRPPPPKKKRKINKIRF